MSKDKEKKKKKELEKKGWVVEEEGDHVIHEKYAKMGKKKKLKKKDED